MTLYPASIVFAIFLGTLAALPPLSIDMALPALGRIATALHGNSTQAGLTLSLFMAGFAVSPLAYGPLADRHGRRPVLLGGLSLFALGGVGAALANSMPLLLAARLVQGAGAGVGMTLAFAMVRDLFDGAIAHARLALITMVANVAPILAPMLGTGVLALGGWRAIYGVTAICGLGAVTLVALALTETRKPTRTSQPMLPALRRDYAQLLGQPAVVIHVLANALGFAWMFAYVAGSSSILLGLYHVAPPVYAGLFACTGAGIVAGAALSGQLAKAGFPGPILLLTAMILALASSVAILLLPELSLWTLMPLLVLATAASGLAAPAASHGALALVPDLAGMAGGFLTCVQMAAGALASWTVAILLPRHGVSAMALVMACCALLALVMYGAFCVMQSRRAARVKG
ncbi:Bcr/CflA family efflux MFS transporter [Acidocella sp.]|uniref:Bcr/CflA family efflux MFS transporter n=1 Tax=Acidocella sp. TaxID=50710 RepID=UPI003D00A023